MKGGLYEFAVFWGALIGFWPKWERETTGNEKKKKTDEN